MPEKKKHHFVPRFYLRFFANDQLAKDPRTVSVYNISRDLVIAESSIADQCAKDRFYGDSDTVENAMATLEGAWASLFRRIFEKPVPPKPKSEDHLLLLLFISLQMLRTNRRGHETNESISDMIKTVASHDSTLSENGKAGLDWELKNPVFLSLRSFLPVAHYLDDLNIHFLQADTSNGFITSDNPIFKYNKYCETATEGGTTGAANAGLLIFTPISPRLTMLLYDGKVYKVGIPGKPGPFAVTSADVDVMNGLQYIGADENLYFSSGLSRAYFQKLTADWRRARQAIGLRTVEAEEVGHPEHTLIHQYHHIPNLQLKLSFLSVRTKARKVPLDQRVRTYRRKIEETGPEPPLEAGPHIFVPVKKGQEVRKTKRKH